MICCSSCWPWMRSEFASRFGFIPLAATGLPFAVALASEILPSLSPAGDSARPRCSPFATPALASLPGFQPPLLRSRSTPAFRLPLATIPGVRALFASRLWVPTRRTEKASSKLRTLSWRQVKRMRTIEVIEIRPRLRFNSTRYNNLTCLTIFTRRRFELDSYDAMSSRSKRSARD